jgi:NAD(P)-dependent dehydrogenase (short-subunit alcohol dehydrogenase family)
MSEQRVVLITGASSGVGQSTARLLSQRGYRVFGTSRDPAMAEPLSCVELLPLDVRRDDSVQACVEAVFRRGGHLEVLINNAGHELAGALEELSPEEARGQFETNFFGVVRMINAVLPFMRQRKAGHIVNVSSLSGLPIPFLGIYSASKFALEGYTEALRHEVKPFGIRVSLTEAGFLRTPMMNNRQFGARRIIEYDPWRQKALDSIRASEEKGSRRDACSAGTPRDRIQREAEATLPDRAPGEVGRAIASVPSRGDVRAGSAPCVLARQECVTCCEDAMPETRLFEIVSWISLPTVMFGGYSLLSLLRKKALSPEQVTFFRAGHAHAGVLLVMSLIYYSYLKATSLSVTARVAACSLLVVGILLQSGGFFWHAFLDKAGQTTGLRITTIGAALLATATLVLVYGLVAS